MSIQHVASDFHHNGCFSKGSKNACKICSRISHPESRVLGEDYVPQEYDVICARGKHFVSHYGNIIFRETLERNLERYHQARSKLDKSLIVIEIVDEIRSRTRDGGFIQQRKDQSDGKMVWIEIGDTMARAKVGHALRDTVRNSGRNRMTTVSDVPFFRNRTPSILIWCGDKSETPPSTISNDETGSTLCSDDAR